MEPSFKLPDDARVIGPGLGGPEFAFFNEERGHQSLECRTPMEVYAESVRLKKTAA